MLAYYVHDLSPFLIRFNETMGIRWYGLSYVLAFGLGILLVQYLSRKGYCDIPEKGVADFIVGGAIFGVLLGGRLGYVLFYDFAHFRHDPIWFFKVWDGGMSAHGGITGLTLYTLWYARRHKISWFNIGDSLALAGPLGIMLGRLANFINGELYGRAATVAWAMQFPGELVSPRTPPEEVQRAVEAATAINPAWSSGELIVENARKSEVLRDSLRDILVPRHPSQLYESALEGAALFSILWILRTRFRLPNGVLMGAFFFFYAIMRSISELFREPDAPLTGALTRGQFLSIFLAAIGIIIAICAWVRPTYPKARPR